MASGLRERARDALRTELAEALSEVFAERGFDAVTVEEAAREAGISRATFFRYFGSKEDAVLATIEASTVDYGAVVAALPAVRGEDPWRLLARAFRQVADGIAREPARARARVRMIASHPALRARLAERRLLHEESLAAALGPRLADPEAARPLAVAALAAADLAWRQWARDAGAELAEVLDAVFARLADAGSSRTR